MWATTPLESTPPDRNAPRGTSDMSFRQRTAARSRSEVSAAAAAGVTLLCGRSKRMSQNEDTDRRRAAPARANVCPGGSLKTSR